MLAAHVGHSQQRYMLLTYFNIQPLSSPISSLRSHWPPDRLTTRNHPPPHHPTTTLPVLDLKKIEQGAMVINAQHVEILQLARDVLQMLVPQVRNVAKLKLYLK